MRHLNSEMKAEKAKFTVILFVFNVTIGCSKKDSIQLSPEGEVNSGVDIPRREGSRCISSTVHRS